VIRALAGIAVLLFVGRSVLAQSGARRAWMKWAKWGAIAAFSLAFLYALGVTLLWAVSVSR
jgi:hypothetical protein